MIRVVRYIVFFVVLILVVLILTLPTPGRQRAVMNQSSTIIVIDAGHGGFDGGAVGRFTNVREDGLNLAVAKKLQKRCQYAGYTIVMTREDGNAVGVTKDADMLERRTIIDGSSADVVISIHMNKYGNSAVSGPQVFYYETSKEGESLAAHIQAQLNTRLEPPRPRVHKPGDYYILRSGESPCVIVECGFLSNEREERLLQTEEYQQECADAIFTGAALYLHERRQSSVNEQISQ